MDKNQIKKVVQVTALNLNAFGYGPHKALKRIDWQNQCKQKLLTGGKSFKEWQEGWIANSVNVDSTANFSYQVRYEDGTTEVLNDVLQNPCTLDFVAQEFHEGINLSYDYLFNADFSGALFANFVIANSAIFHGFAFFNNTKFETLSIFESCVFKANTYFNAATFSGEIDFTDTEFDCEVYFTNANFKNMARFVNTEFKALAHFKFAKFKNEAWFFSTKFYGHAIFAKSEFHSDCIFNKWFVYVKYGAEFYDEVNFEDCIIENVGHFENAIFRKNIPSFLGDSNSKNSLIFSDDEYFNKNDTSDDAIIRLGQLKRMADNHGQTDQALMFNAFELNAKRAQSRIKTNTLNFMQKFVNSDYWFANATALYGIFSSYGRSFTKPLKYYLGLLLVVYILALGNAVVNSPKDCKAENLRMLSDLWRDDTPCDISKTNPDDKTRLNGYRAATEYAVYRAAGILDFSDNGKGTDAVARRLFGQSYEPGWMRFVGLVKAVASTVLLFLAALGLRNKYRIK